MKKSIKLILGFLWCSLVFTACSNKDMSIDWRPYGENHSIDYKFLENHDFQLEHNHFTYSMRKTKVDTSLIFEFKLKDGRRPTEELNMEDYEIIGQVIEISNVRKGDLDALVESFGGEQLEKYVIPDLSIAFMVLTPTSNLMRLTYFDNAERLVIIPYRPMPGDAEHMVWRK